MVSIGPIRKAIFKALVFYNSEKCSPNGLVWNSYARIDKAVFGDHPGNKMTVLEADDKARVDTWSPCRCPNINSFSVSIPLISGQGREAGALCEKG